MPSLNLALNHKPIVEYYAELQQLSFLHKTHEGAVRGAFQTLLAKCAKQFNWTVVGEYEVKRPKRPSLRVDGALVDPWSLTHGYWEAKDEHDDLKTEVKKKIALGYPTDNILFQSPDRVILLQNGKQILDEPIKDKKEHASNLVEALKEFFRYQPPAYDQWEQAVEEFRTQVPDFAKALLKRIHDERKLNSIFTKSFAGFLDVCRQAINPNLSEQAVEEMLVQHMLTERIFRKVFDNPDFAHRNAIAAEIEKVIGALTARSFSREKFLAGLDRFYGAIEATASTIESFTEKQHFLNTVYEKFFQGFSVKVADTHGIVYTPQPLVKFMVRSVDEILKREFGKSFGSKGVHVLDPFVGTGNFMLHIMRQIPKTQLAYKYEHELHANEVMLLPYYIAAMNIEHEYAEMMAEYKPFDGLCLADTFELAEDKHPSLFTEQNTARVERQRRSPIFVVIGNPPYNAWQVDENDKNRNRKYPILDKRIGETFAKDSAATLVNSLSDPYVKAFRWGIDRLGDEGVLAYVSNSSYVTQFAFDGMRKHLAQDFDAIYVLDLGGNIRKNPKLSGTTHNVFGIQVGVAIGLFVRRRGSSDDVRQAEIFYAKTGEDWRKEDKYRFLEQAQSYRGIEWQKLTPDVKHTWLTEGLREDFARFIPIVSCRENAAKGPEGIFRISSNGLKSNNDAYVYDFQWQILAERARRMVEAYNAELHRWRAADSPGEVDDFIRVDERVLKWIHDTKQFLRRGITAKFDKADIRPSLYRPFVREWVYFNRMFNNRLYLLPTVFPKDKTNIAIIEKTGSEWPPFAFITDITPDLLPQGGSQVFPFYTYDEDGSNRRENITDWARDQFRAHYGDNAIRKWDIFYYVYALLYHPAYRTCYRTNLKRELPRIPYAPNFWAFAKAGKCLAELHLNYEKQDEYPLDRIENPELPLNWRVEKMRLNKQRDQIVYNEFLTLAGIPPEVFEYKLGNRSALEWVIDQYQVNTDKRSGITNDPNRLDDPEYIVRLIGQVVTVSLETVNIVRNLPPLGIEGETDGTSGGAADGEEDEAEQAPAESHSPSKPKKAGANTAKAAARGAIPAKGKGAKKRATVGKAKGKTQ